MPILWKRSGRQLRYAILIALTVRAADEGADDVPVMPTVPAERRHRHIRATHHIPNALTVRPLNKKEVNSTPAAKASIDKEWDRLRRRMAWDQSTVREWSDVAAEARREGDEVHMGMLFGFVVEKNPDLPEGDSRRKFKGRVVFQGNNVVNQNWEAAMFQDLGNAPATMEASRIADCYGCFSSQ